jgi:fluoride exporter
MLYLYVAFGGAFGALLRYGLGTWITSMAGKEFPYATFTINILGSFLMGAAIALLVSMLPRGKELHALVVVGALGGFTTFSAFAFESYLLLERGNMGGAMIYILGSVGLSIVAFFLGMAIFKAVLA